MDWPSGVGSMALRAPSLRVLPRALAAALLAAVVVFPLAAWVLHAHVKRAAVAALVSNATMGAESVRDRVDELRRTLEAAAPSCSRRLLDDPPQSPRLERMLEAMLAATPRLAAVAVVAAEGRVVFAVAPDADGFDPQVWFGRAAPRRSPLVARDAEGRAAHLWLPLSVAGDADVRVVGVVDSRTLLPRTSPTHDGECLDLVLPTANQPTATRVPGADLRLELDDRSDHVALRVELPSAPRAIERMTAAVTTPLLALGALLVLTFGLAARLGFGARVRAVGERHVKARHVWFGPRVAVDTQPRATSREPGPIVLKATPSEVADCDHDVPAPICADDPDHRG